MNALPIGMAVFVEGYKAPWWVEENFPGDDGPVYPYVRVRSVRGAVRNIEMNMVCPWTEAQCDEDYYQWLHEKVEAWYGAIDWDDEP